MGRYVLGLLEGLGELHGLGELDAPFPLLTVLSLRGRLPEPLPAGARAGRRRVPARLLHRLWAHGPFPPVELLTGRLDVFHATNFVLPPTRRAAGVVTVHDLAYLRYPQTVDAAVLAYRDLVPRGLQRAARVVTVSEAVRGELCEEYALDPARVVVAPHGVDPGWSVAVPLPAAARTGLQLPECYLLFVGNTEPRKGLDTLVAAHAAARHDDPGTPPLVLVGPPGWGDVWQGSPPDPRHVRSLGFLDERVLRAVVAGASALCLPSRYEGFGLPVLEALACGRPVLASDLAAHREVGGDLVDYLPAGDVAAWAEALLEAGARPPDPDAEQRRRDRADQFRWRDSARTHLRVWQESAREARR